MFKRSLRDPFLDTFIELNIGTFIFLTTMFTLFYAIFIMARNASDPSLLLVVAIIANVYSTLWIYAALKFIDRLKSSFIRENSASDIDSTLIHFNEICLTMDKMKFKWNPYYKIIDRSLADTISTWTYLNVMEAPNDSLETVIKMIAVMDEINASRRLLMPVLHQSHNWYRRYKGQ